MGLPDWVKDTDFLGIDPVVSDDPFDITGRHAAEAASSAAALQSDAAIQAALIQAASQEQGLNATLEQLGITRESFAPFLEAGVGALPELQQGFQSQQGATLGGMDAMIAEIMGTDSFGALRQEREQSVQGQLSAGGLTRSGAAMQEMANVPTDLAFEIENMIFNRGQSDEIARIQGLQNLTSTGLNAAGMSGSQSASMTTQIANQMAGIGTTQAGGITGSASATASGILGAQQAEAQGTQNIMSLAAMFFSDNRLKTNIKKIGKAGPLDLVTWDWIPELKDSFVTKFPTTGFLSSQVKEHYPEYIGEFGSYDTVDYGGLMKFLEPEITFHAKGGSHA